MKRFAVLLLGALVGAWATAASVSAATGTASRAHLRAFVCQHALDPAQRSISVDGVMRPVLHTLKMEIRFDLLARDKPSGGYSAVHGGDLGTWLTPLDQPTLGQRPGDVWQISHPVTGLQAPATYRYRVVFRWIGAHDHVLSTRTVLSPRCFQPELRPDLLVVSITRGSIVAHPKQESYTALIRNAGATSAGPFQVVFSAAGASTPQSNTRMIARLRPGASRTVTFDGAACTASTAPTISVDPSHEVDDFDLANNSLTVPGSCPAVTKGASPGH